MILSINPAKFIAGKIEIPPSKSYSIRAFIIAACGGRSIIINPSECDDAVVARNAAGALGAHLKRFQKNNWDVSGFKRKTVVRKINVGESGTVLRLLLPLLSLSGKPVVVMGKGTLRGRPNVHLLTALRRMGAQINGQGKNESVPISIRKGNLHGGPIEVEGTVSSQFISALLIVCPLLKEDTKLVIKADKLVSQTYITMTEEILKKSGITIRRANSGRTYFIPGGQEYRGLGNFTVPPDYGLAAFFMAAAVLVPSKVILKGHLTDKFIQADGKIFDFLRRMGARWEKTSLAITISGPFELKGGEFSLKDCPDLVPIMSILALFAKGKTRLYDIGHVRAKESDRISDLKGELLKIGAQVKE